MKLNKRSYRNTICVKPKYLKILLGALLVNSMMGMIGCAGGNSGAANTINSTDTGRKVAVSKSLRLGTGDSIQQLDFYNEDYGASNSKNLCSSGICLTLNKVPYGLYKNNLWIQQYYPTTLTVSFKEDVKGFGINSIFNDTSSASGVLVGKIAQIDMNDCNSLVKQGNLVGKSCVIKFNYKGITKNNLSKNTINFNFNVNNGQVTFPFDIVNQELSSSKSPIIQAGTAENSGDHMPVVLYSPTLVELDIGYERMTSKMKFTNFGDTLVGDGANTTLQAYFADPLSVGGNAGQNFYYTTDLLNDCGMGSIANLKTCSFPLFMYEDPNFQSITSYINNYLVRYTIVDSTNQAKTINTVSPFVVSIGDIQPIGDQDLPIDGGTLALRKINLGESGLNYSLPLENFQLYAKYNPQFNLSTSAVGSKVLYDFGDLNSNGFPYTYDQLVSKITFDFDQNCFNSGFDPQYDGYELKSSRTCLIKVKSPLNELLAQYPNLKNYLAVVGFDLYASYNSPTENKQTNQYIGHIKLLTDSKTNPIVNASLCTNLNWDKNIINCTYTAKDWYGGIVFSSKTQQFDYSSCKMGDSVEQRIVQVPVHDQHGFVATTYDKPELYCSSNTLQLPQGSYQNTCKDIAWDGKVLFAGCKDNQGNYNNSILYYANCSGSTVSNISGKLSCDF